ncbi:MAG: divalent-cation tolerance protein CutA, partial [Candidatus Obscuribacterales bacterium]|nr:divalent-cation tolerance protein CutA [Candidatus Obscuribacterales bacterium]
TSLVEERLAACVNIIDKITSIYFWEGEIQKDDESLLLIKSSEAIWDALQDKIREIHPYEVPEIICLPIELGNKNYLNWLNQSIFPEGSEDDEVDD